VTRRRRISLPNLGGLSVPKEALDGFTQQADVHIAEPREPAKEGRGAAETAPAPEPAPEPPPRTEGTAPRPAGTETPRRGRGRPPTHRGARNRSFRLTPADQEIMDESARRAILAGESPLKVNNAIIVRAALRVLQRAPDDWLLEALDEARQD